MRRPNPLTAGQIKAIADRAAGSTSDGEDRVEPYSLDRPAKAKKPTTRGKAKGTKHERKVATIKSLVVATMPAKAGRPSLYTVELGERICGRIASGEMLNAICADDGMPDRRTIWKWRRADEAFRDLYAQAREDQMETFVEQIIEISDDSSGDVVVDDEGFSHTQTEVVARSRLRVDTRKWLMSQLASKRFAVKPAPEANASGAVAGSGFVLNLILADTSAEPKPTMRVIEANAKR